MGNEHLALWCWGSKSYSRVRWYVTKADVLRPRSHCVSVQMGESAKASTRRDIKYRRRPLRFEVVVGRILKVKLPSFTNLDTVYVM